MYLRLPNKICPICKQKGDVVKVTYKGCEEEIFIECEGCWTVIEEVAQ